MPLWGIKYMDLDERWWLDLLLDEKAREVRSVAMGARVFVDDTPLILRPAAEARRS